MKHVISNGEILEQVDSPLIAGWETCTDLKAIPDGTSVPVNNKIKHDVEWMRSRIPASLMKKVLGTIKQFPYIEIGMVLEYRFEDDSWNIEITEQSKVSGVHVAWEDTVQHDGYMSMGTIHTHPQMSAFFSGEDVRNDEKAYGVHLVLGLTDGVVTSTASAIYTPTGRYDKDFWRLVESVDFNSENYEPVPEWVEIINRGKKYSDMRLEDEKPSFKGHNITINYPINIKDDGFPWNKFKDDSCDDRFIEKPELYDVSEQELSMCIYDAFNSVGSEMDDEDSVYRIVCDSMLAGVNKMKKSGWSFRKMWSNMTEACSVAMAACDKFHLCKHPLEKANLVRILGTALYSVLDLRMPE